MPVQRVHDFETWRQGYGGALVTVYVGGTTTLADVFYDEALSQAAPNPQVLTSDIGGNGKFAQPLYTAQSYELNIDGSNVTGINRPPLSTLNGIDGSGALVVPTGGLASNTLADLLARVVHATDFGQLSDASASENTATLSAAIGVVAGNNGGTVVLPDGTFPFTQLTIPEGVILMGQGEGTTILQSQTGDKVVTISGDLSGLANLSIDGVNNQAGSIGVYSKANDRIVLQDVLIQRFETGIHLRGASSCNWRNLSVYACGVGAKLHGDSDASGAGDGAKIRFIDWQGGKVTDCTGTGIDLSYEDIGVGYITIRNVGFVNNTGKAVRVNGARQCGLRSCWFNGNASNFEILDDDDTDKRDENTVIGLEINSCEFVEGTMTFADNCEDVVFRNCDLSGIDITLTIPKNPVLAVDCSEDKEVTISGDGTKWARQKTIDHGAASGLTTDATAVKAWSYELKPGEVVYVEAKVVANQINGANRAVYHRAVSAYRPGSDLDFDTQTKEFVTGEVLTGGTSGTTALIQAITDNGADGTLTLRSIDGDFEDNETIAGETDGEAFVNGSITHKDAALGGSVNDIRPVYETVAGYDATFVVTGNSIELRVTGAASHTVEWLTDVSLKRLG